MSKRPYVFGLDIGYSNLKTTDGFVSAEEGFTDAITSVRPVASAPVRDCITSDNDTADERVPVEVNGEPWYACIEPNLIRRDRRQLNYDYMQTDQYEAAFKAALLSARDNTIDVLVTGLPVSQAKNSEAVARIRALMEGEHQVAAKRTVTVKKVVVRPQPSAAFVRMVYEHSADEKMSRLIQHGQVVVVDPGFFSVDWVTVKNGGLVKETSGTSILAMYRVIEETAETLCREYGAGQSIRKDLERAIRSGQKDVIANGEFVEFAPFLEQASRNTATYALNEMKSDMALQDNVADILVLTGGGASLYEEEARKILSNCRHVITFDNPVTAIAEGYWLIGQAMALAQQDAAA